MHLLIGQIRNTLLFDNRAARLCSDDCQICSLKLLDYLEQELEGWQQRLAQGDHPDFGDLTRLAESARRIHRALEESGLLQPPSAADTEQKHDTQSEDEPKRP